MTLPKNRASVNPIHSADMASLHQKANVKIKEICKMFPQYSQATIYRHAKREIGADPPINRSKFNKGRPPKLSEGDKRNLSRSVRRLRGSHGTFSSMNIQVEAGLERKVSNRTVRRALNNLGYNYLNTRKKGLMKNTDFAKRVKFCRNIKKRNLDINFWRKGISFYLDGTGFEYKTNPFESARTPKSKEWRKTNEGLTYTQKGKKEGVVNTNFMVAISYNKGVVLCSHYEGQITGSKMANIVLEDFEEALASSNGPKVKRFLMDGCPRQSSKVAFRAYDTVGAKVMILPPRSPDLNPIENFFHLIKILLKKEAIAKNITAETIGEFNTRVKDNLRRFPVNTINKIIDSMPKRIDMVLKAKGRRIKY